MCVDKWDLTVFTYIRTYVCKLSLFWCIHTTCICMYMCMYVVHWREEAALEYQNLRSRLAATKARMLQYLTTQQQLLQVHICICAYTYVCAHTLYYCLQERATNIVLCEKSYDMYTCIILQRSPSIHDTWDQKGLSWWLRCVMPNLDPPKLGPVGPNLVAVLGPMGPNSTWFGCCFGPYQDKIGPPFSYVDCSIFQCRSWTNTDSYYDIVLPFYRMSLATSDYIAHSKNLWLVYSSTWLNNPHKRIALISINNWPSFILSCEFLELPSAG